MDFPWQVYLDNQIERASSGVISHICTYILGLRLPCWYTGQNFTLSEPLLPRLCDWDGVTHFPGALGGYRGCY